MHKEKTLKHILEMTFTKGSLSLEEICSSDQTILAVVKEEGMLGLICYFTINVFKKAEYLVLMTINSVSD